MLEGGEGGCWEWDGRGWVLGVGVGCVVGAGVGCVGGGLGPRSRNWRRDGSSFEYGSVVDEVVPLLEGEDENGQTIGDSFGGCRIGRSLLLVRGRDMQFGKIVLRELG